MSPLILVPVPLQLPTWFANARHMKSGLRQWLLRIRRWKLQRESITEPLGTLSGKLPEQGPITSTKSARSLRATRPELISFGRSQRRHLVILACNFFTATITHRKWHLGPYRERESWSPAYSLLCHDGFWMTEEQRRRSRKFRGARPLSSLEIHKSSKHPKYNFSSYP